MLNHEATRVVATEITKKCQDAIQLLLDDSIYNPSDYENYTGSHSSGTAPWLSAKGWGRIDFSVGSPLKLFRSDRTSAVRSARPGGGWRNCRTAGLDEGGGRIIRPAARGTLTPQHIKAIQPRAPSGQYR